MFNFFLAIIETLMGEREINRRIRRARELRGLGYSREEADAIAYREIVIERR